MPKVAAKPTAKPTASSSAKLTVRSSAKTSTKVAATLSAKKLSAKKLSAKKLSAKKLSAKKLSAKKLSAKKLSAKKLSAKKLSAKKLSAKKLSAKELSAKELSAKSSAKSPAKVGSSAKVAAKPTGPAPFTGFSKTAPGFFHELAVEMNRDWFTANKERYEREWVRPMTALLEHVHAALVPVYKPVKLGPPKVMRIHRDVRFSKDKAPYKTHIGAVITSHERTLGEGGNAAMYLHLGADEEFVGVGTYMFHGDKLAKWRKAVAGKAGAELATLIAKLRKAGYEVGGHDDFKRVPRPYAEDHPRADLLKLRGLTAGPGEIPKGMLHDAKLAPWLVAHGTALAPLVKWLEKHVG